MRSAFNLPAERKLLIPKAQEIIEACRSSQGMRAAFCRQLNAIIETGRQDGSKSLINLLYRVIDKLSSFLYSPTDLRFAIDFENIYPKAIDDQAKMAARVLTRDWERRNTDVQFGQGVFESLKYGAAILKQWVQQEGADRIPVYYSKLVMPWQFGVYNEGNNDLGTQPAMVETSLLTMPEVWRRIYHFPDAEHIYRRIQTHASQSGDGGAEQQSFFHQVLSTSTLNTSAQGMTQQRSGGIVQLNNDPNYAIVAPQVAAPRVKLHELWLWDDDDYTTVQLIEPDILIAPRFKRANLLISGDTHSGLQPYTLIQPNMVHGYFWGRSEVSDLIEPQGLLSTTAEDVKRLWGLQVDKILAIASDDVTDETYGQMRSAGFLNLGQNGKVQDLTPPFPAEAMPMLDFLIRLVNMLAGLDNILSGSGTPGVRAGVHADTLMKTASPQLKDRSLLVERQCAMAADLRLSLMEAKDARRYWTDPNKMEETTFSLHDIPEDRRVIVDSHSSSPIFKDNHEQLVGFGLKGGFIDGESAIEMLEYPQKDLLVQRYKERQAAQKQMLEQLRAQDPDAYVKAISGRGRR